MFSGKKQIMPKAKPRAKTMRNLTTRARVKKLMGLGCGTTKRTSAKGRRLTVVVKGKVLKKSHQLKE